MTIVRNEQEPLPRPAQLWASMPSTDGMFEFLSRRFFVVCLIAALVPAMVVGLGFMSATFTDAYSAGGDVLGWPVVARGEAPRGWISIGEQAVGVVAIGVRAVGVIAIGPFAIGVVAIGSVAAGAISLSVLSLGLWSIGAVSLGWVALGPFAAGRFALGAVAVGWYACGARAIGVYAWGVVTAWGFKRAEIIAPRSFGPPQKTEKLLFPNWRRADPAQ